MKHGLLLQSPETVHILHVDDNLDNLASTKMLLDRPGIEVVSASSAASAFVHLREQEFALALLDVNMPMVNGFQLAESMRQDVRTMEVPIIFVTGASDDAEKAFRGYEAGAVDFLLKPVPFWVLESKVGAFVALYRQRRSLREQRENCERLLLANQRLAAELTLAHESALQASLTDELTGVSNRRHILQLAEGALNDPRRHSQPVSLALLDLDHFKKINDSHGHAFGDAVLRHFCHHTRTHLRAGQSMGRLGGEEFLLLLPGTELAEAVTALERVRSTLPPCERIAYRFSAGVAQARSHETLSDVLERADRALYVSKERGRDCTSSELMGL